MKKIVANFKMNGTNSQLKNYFMKLVSKAKEEKFELVLCPPFTSISLASFLLEGSDVKLGGQNLCDEEEGKCTGEISGSMLKDAGADYVIVGHSERRIKFRESARSINKKIKIALKNRLKVVLCIGETLAEKNTLKTGEVLRGEIEDAVKGLYENELDNITIAYEPVWAIGTGKTPTAKEIVEATKVIRKTIAEIFSEKAGEKIEIIYGGSVDNKNCGLLSKIKEINGFMIGSACQDCDNFVQLLKDIKPVGNKK